MLYCISDIRRKTQHDGKFFCITPTIWENLLPRYCANMCHGAFAMPKALVSFFWAEWKMHEGTNIPQLLFSSSIYSWDKWLICVLWSQELAPISDKTHTKDSFSAFSLILHLVTHPNEAVQSVPGSSYKSIIPPIFSEREDYFHSPISLRITELFENAKVQICLWDIP